MISLPLYSSDTVISEPKSVVYADPQDPYFTLATEIAAEINSTVVTDFLQIAKILPEMLVWVSSPAFLSESRVLTLCRMKGDSNWFPVSGIITGRTMQSARELWQRGTDEHTKGRSHNLTIAGDTDHQAEVEPGIIKTLLQSEETFITMPLNLKNLKTALSDSRYFYWARHTSKRQWMWHNAVDGKPTDEGRLSPEEIPLLPDSLIYTPSCGSFYPWEKDLLAMEFIEKGASAYVGHIFSPITSGLFAGHMTDFPPLHTWKDFPLGAVVQIQNRAGFKAVYSMPNFMLLGNPFQHEKEEPPYTVLLDQSKSGERIIRGISREKGLIPILINGGKSYSYINAGKAGSFWLGSRFIQKHIWGASIGENLYLLIPMEKGESFSLYLKTEPPVLHRIISPIINSLDYSLIVTGPANSLFGLFLVLPFVIVTGIRLGTRDKTPDFSAILIGIIFSGLYLSYLLLRQDQQTVSVYPTRLSWQNLLFGAMGIASSIALGQSLLNSLNKVSGKIFAVIIGVLPQFLVFSFYSVTILVMNIRVSQSHPDGIRLWNSSIPALLGCGLLVQILAFLGANFFNRRIGDFRIKRRKDADID